MNDLQTKRRNLKIYSIVFLILAAVDVAQLVLNLAVDDTPVDLSNSLVRTVLIVMIAFAAVVALAKAFLGIQGMRQAKGTAVGRAHLTISMIALVLSVIGALLVILAAIQEANLWEIVTNIWDSLISIWLLVSYRKAAKALLNA